MEERRREEREAWQRHKQQLEEGQEAAMSAVRSLHAAQVEAFEAQEDQLQQRIASLTDALAARDAELAELNEALEELEAEKRRDLSEAQAESAREKGRLQHCHRQRVRQLEGRYEREQQALRSFVLSSAKSMLSHANVEKALKRVDVWSDSEDDSSASEDEARPARA